MRSFVVLFCYSVYWLVLLVRQHSLPRPSIHNNGYDGGGVAYQRQRTSFFFNCPSASYSLLLIKKPRALIILLLRLLAGVVGTPTLITRPSIHNNGCADGGVAYQQRRSVSTLMRPSSWPKNLSSLF